MVGIYSKGTLAEKLRGGAAGIPAFYVRTGADTDVEEGRLVLRYGPNLAPKLFAKPKEVCPVDFFSTNYVFCVKD